MKRKVSILIPAYNEEAVLKILFERLMLLINSLPNYDWEILFVNDGSKDNTLLVLMQFRELDKRINILDLSRNYGKEVAMMAGFDYVTGDCMVILDADLQDPPELIVDMLQYWEQGYDDVFAKRNSRAGESFPKKLTSTIYYSVLQKLSKIPIQKDTGDFRLLDKSCIEALRKMRESQRYTKGLFSWIGFNKKEILFDRDPRAGGVTKFNYIKLLGLAIEGITSFTTIPLRLASFFGVLISIIAFVYMCYVLIKSFIWSDPVPGYPSLMVVVLFIGGIQLLFLGFIGEYLARIFHETKNRPVYFASKYNGEKLIN